MEECNRVEQLYVRIMLIEDVDIYYKPHAFIIQVLLHYSHFERHIYYCKRKNKSTKRTLGMKIELRNSQRILVWFF